MNFTILLFLAPLSIWVFTIPVPPNATVTIYSSLPPLCNSTPTTPVQGPATVDIVCVNPYLHGVRIAGWINLEPAPPTPPTPIQTPEVPAVAIATGVAAVAGLSHLVSNRRELLLVPIAPIISRIKTASADDPVRKEILRVVEQMGAVTLSQIVKLTKKSWGAVQWHVYVLEREGRLKSVKIGPFTYYFTNPRTAAEIILSSVDPGSLSLEDREKLDIMASAVS
mgnify:CR=1 FL=1